MARTPLRDGWRVLIRAPEAVLGEIVWRWSFGAVLGVVVILSFHHYFSTIEISRAEYETLKSLEPLTWIAITVRVLRAFVAGVRAMGPVLIPAFSVLWIVFATLGRAGTVRALANSATRTHWAASFSLNALRLAVSFACLLAFFGCGVLVNRFANPATDPAVPFLLMVVVLFTISLIWSILNWVLGSAIIFAAKDGAGLPRAFVGAADLYSVAMGRVGVWFGLMRAALFCFGTVVSLILASAMLTGQSRGPAVAIVGVTLLYFALCDFLYVWRLATYISLMEPESFVAEMPAVPLTPAPQELFPRQPETDPAEASERLVEIPAGEVKADS